MESQLLYSVESWHQFMVGVICLVSLQPVKQCLINLPRFLSSLTKKFRMILTQQPNRIWCLKLTFIFTTLKYLRAFKNHSYGIVHKSRRPNSDTSLLLVDLCSYKNLKFVGRVDFGHGLWTTPIQVAVLLWFHLHYISHN